jgi:hypothetical protein
MPRRISALSVVEQGLDRLESKRAKPRLLQSLGAKMEPIAERA